MSRRRARASVPPMTAEQAILLVDVLDRITRAVWRTYGEEMASHPMLHGSCPPPRDAVPEGNPNADDIDF